MKSKALLCFLCLLTLSAFGQVTINGKIVDKNTKESLAFANIQFDRNPKLQITSDINGNFSFVTNKMVTALKCSYVGFITEETAISETTQFPLTIELTAKSTTLNEVVITQKENPVLEIIRKAILNKKRNNPENITSFRYQCYNKIVVDFNQKNISKGKSDIFNKAPNKKPFFLMENVTNRKFLSPDVSEEVVIASRVSGLKNPSFASLATDMQPFAFYQDNIKLANIYYLNPISKGSLNKYKFRLEDTFEKGKDTVFVISFEPRQNKNFDGLQGILYINSNQYAIQNVVATPFKKAKINLKIQQQYQWVKDKYWFPDQLNYSLTISDFSQIKLQLLIEGKSYLNNIDVDIPLEKKDFSYESVRIEGNATKRDTAFWANSRFEKLTSNEIFSYKYLDSLGSKKNFDGSMKLIEKFSKNKIPFYFVDFDISKSFGLNKYEGTRLGTGLNTNELFSKKVMIGGFAGYGTKDMKWKYGGETNYSFNEKKDFSIGMKYQNNLVEIGNYGLRTYSNELINFRNLIGASFDGINQYSLQSKFRTLRYLNAQISLNQTNVKPLYGNSFSNSNLYFNEFQTTDISIFGRYAFKEKIAQFFGSNSSLGSDYPIVYFLLTHGLKDFMGSDLQYNKCEIAVEHSFFIKNFGKTRYRLETGYIDTALPIGLMFTGEGSSDNANPYVAKNTFQTMLPYEFVSDCYANLFLSHNFGTLLFKSSYFEPSFSIHNNLSWGNLNQSNFLSLSQLQYSSKDKLFSEAGLQIDNILKLNMLNIGYLGIGTAIFHRYGYYSKPNFRDTMVYKITFSFTIR